MNTQLQLLSVLQLLPLEFTVACAAIFYLTFQIHAEVPRRDLTHSDKIDFFDKLKPTA
jgi:hypothetical protein